MNRYKNPARFACRTFRTSYDCTGVPMRGIYHAGNTNAICVWARGIYDSEFYYSDARLLGWGGQSLPPPMARGTGCGTLDAWYQFGKPESGTKRKEEADHASLSRATSGWLELAPATAAEWAVPAHGSPAAARQQAEGSGAFPSPDAPAESGGGTTSGAK